MYAVGKVLYTVAAPFHPFGGAVDIVVVQQQDGSFKSSPWYVRFGKFQGVLKTREKVVKIAVNGIEAGFNMYLDSNGQAHFLRDADSSTAEGGFVVPASSSGDERVVPTQDSQLRKSKSTSCDISTMEASAGDGKVLARRSTILERMFGRKSVKDSAHAVDRVCSLERAEIAAELLDTNWSTSRGSEARSSNHEPSSNHLTDAGKGKVETTQMVFPDCSFDHNKAMGSNCDNVDNTVGNPHEGRKSLGDEKEHCKETTSVEEEVVAIYMLKTGDFADGIISTIDRSGSASLPNDMDTGKSINGPFGTQGELQGNFEDVTIREMNTEEVLSHGIFEIRAIETDIPDGKSEVVSQFMAVGSDGVSQNFTQTNSPIYSTTLFSSEMHDGSLIDCGHDACQEKVVSISSPGTVENSCDVSSILADKVRDTKGISLTDGLRSEECSSVSSEKIEEIDVDERSLSYHGDSSSKEDIYNLDVPEVSVFEDLNSQTSQANLADKGISVDTLVNDHRDISVDTVADDHSTCSAHNLACQNGLLYPDASSSGIDMLSYVHENDPDDVTEDCTLETKICYGEHDVPFIQTSEMEVVSRACITQLANFPNKGEGEVSPIMYGSSLSKVHMENTKLDYDENGSSSAGGVEIGPVPEEPSNKAAVVSLSKLVEEKTVCPNKLEVEISPINSDSSSLSEVEAKNTKLEDDVNRPSSASGVALGPVSDDPRDRAETVVSLSKLVEKTTVCSNILEIEISPIISESSSLSKVETKNTKLEDNVNRPGSTSGVDVGPVPIDPSDKAEAIVSSCEFLDEIQFQFSDTRSLADGKTLDDVVANKASGGGVHDEVDGNSDEEGGDDIDLVIKAENHSDLSSPETILIPIPGSELHLGDNNLEAKSLPNLRSHIQDLVRSDSFQGSCSLYNSDSSVVDSVKSKVSSFPEQQLEGTGESKENSDPPELINNPVPDDKHSDDLKVDSFSPFVELSLCGHLLSEGMGADAACRAFDAEKITLEKFRAMKQSLISNNKLVVRISGRYFPWDVASPVVLGMVSFSEEQVFEHQGMIKVERVEPSTTQGGSWRIWPFGFRRTTTMNTIQPVCEPVCESALERTLSIPVKELDGERNKPRAKRMERTVPSLTPTSEELASLDLREGRNVVTFTFSTAMLGIQQVDAHIYLWKWNTHIVISDVDGTITKSDVLGQFMPMVGVDWSQNGVAHLFSAIKENGYQLLFLSARSISQAHLTRQFLFNLKQDGKALPDGPVVISPDGLFPSLYREVIRRAPHEFKISCLGAIKALFPPDSHPFYAGFGNRDTDELSYLKVGIPMGKIFIINPKGEVAVNRRVNTTKSYMSLHALVNRMFPPISSPPEQEDYNTWNYWKMPLPDI